MSCTHDAGHRALRAGGAGRAARVLGGDAVNDLLLGDMRAVLAALEPKSVHLCITSPPFYAKRRYQGEQGQTWADDSICALGHEPTPDLFVAHLIECFAAVKRVLRDDGVLVVEIGDSYAGSGKGIGSDHGKAVFTDADVERSDWQGMNIPAQTRIGIPERFVLAMAADGWRGRDSLIWRHMSAMPESVSGVFWMRCRIKVKAGNTSVPQQTREAGKSSWTVFSGQGTQREALSNPEYADCPGCARCEPNGGYVLRQGQWRETVAHSYVYVFSKTNRYYGDPDAVKTPRKPESLARYEYGMHGQTPNDGVLSAGSKSGAFSTDRMGDNVNPNGANLRSVLDIGPEPFTLELCSQCRHVYKAKHHARLAKRDGKRVCGCGSTEWVSHYATYPTKLPELFIRAFTSEAGCCPKCQAPFARVIERSTEPVPDDPSYKRRGQAVPDPVAIRAFSSASDTYGPNFHYEQKTIGWRPTCSHGDLAPIPCSVLDCFVGTGSTLVAAQRNGRAGIGVDCSQDYLDLCAARLAETPAALI